MHLVGAASWGGERGCAGFSPSPTPGRGSAHIVLNNYPQREFFFKALLNKSSTFVLPGAADRGPCLFSPPYPPLAHGYESVIRRGEGTLTGGGLRGRAPPLMPTLPVLSA